MLINYAAVLDGMTDTVIILFAQSEVCKEPGKPLAACRWLVNNCDI